MSIVCFGEALIDFLSDGKEPESFTKYAGGAPANVAVAVAKQGVPASFCGMVGQDMFGEFLKSELSQHGVNTHYVKSTDKAKTALAFVSLDSEGERSFSFYRPPAADLLFRKHDFEDTMFKEHKILHVCSNSLTEKSIYKTTISALHEAKKAQCLTSFDMNLRINLWSSDVHITSRVWHVISLSDIVKLSTEELTFLNQNSHGHRTEEETIQAIIESGVKVLLVTDGAGDIGVFTDSQAFNVTPPKVKAIDTTAGGDAFIGGFLAELVRHSESGFDPLFENPESLRNIVFFASQCGAFAVTKYGAFSSLPGPNDIS